VPAGDTRLVVTAFRGLDLEGMLRALNCKRGRNSSAKMAAACRLL
jgi:hypothetical protein